MQTKTFARIGAIAFAAVAITATAIEMRAVPAANVEVAAAPPTTTAGDPLQAQILRCQSIGEAGASDPACLAAWRENRRRFFALDADTAKTLPVPSEVTEVSPMEALAKPADSVMKSANPASDQVH